MPRLRTILTFKMGVILEKVKGCEKMAKQHDWNVRVSFDVFLCNVEGKPKTSDIQAYLEGCVSDASICDMFEEIEIEKTEDLGESTVQY